MEKDWGLTSEMLLDFFPKLLKLTGSAVGIELDLKQELQKDRTPMRTITAAYLQLVREAKGKRKPGEPWPVIIIDEANRLTSWKDNEALEQLLTFFVYITKQMQLAHGGLAAFCSSHARGLTRPTQ